jgi:PAS domain-containing protein
MSGHSILYLGHGEFAADYLSELETLPCCTMLTRSNSLELPDDASYIVDLVLLEAGPLIAQSGQSLASLIQSLDPYPVVALTRKEHEHRGIAAVRAGAQGYLCIDDITVEGQDAVFDHAVQRSRLQRRLSDTDVTVLSILRNINDGVIVVDKTGHVLDINPAARTILGLGPRVQPDPTWEQTFCCIDKNGDSYRNAHELPLVRARNGEKFANQTAIYRTPEQPDAVLSINGQGLYDGNRKLIGGLITFRDVTEITNKTTELERRAQFEFTARRAVCRFRSLQVGQRDARPRYGRRLALRSGHAPEEQRTYR